VEHRFNREQCHTEPATFIVQRSIDRARRGVGGNHHADNVPHPRMIMQRISLRNCVAVSGIATASVLLTAVTASLAQLPVAQPATEQTAVLSERESLKYGMFIHFGTERLRADQRCIELPHGADCRHAHCRARKSCLTNKHSLTRSLPPFWLPSVPAPADIGDGTDAGQTIDNAGNTDLAILVGVGSLSIKSAVLPACANLPLPRSPLDTACATALDQAVGDRSSTQHFVLASGDQLHE